MALVALLLLTWGGVGPGEAHAAPPELLTQFGSKGNQAGGLGELGPTAIAADPSTGHLLIAGGEAFSTERVDEFTAWGEFVRAFGWGVAPGAVNEQQEVRIRAAAGQFHLGFGADTTADLPFNATGEEVAAALNDLASVQAGGGSVSVAVLKGAADGTSPYIYVVTFSGGPLSDTNVPQLVVADGSVPLSGGSPATGKEVRTRANGTPRGTGLQSCTLESSCKSGTGGAGPGQFGPGGLRSGRGIAVAPDGSIYVYEMANSRVQKFAPDGTFLYMIGGEVNKTTHANICTIQDVERGDTCGAGVVGDTSSQFGIEPPDNASYYNAITVGTDGTVYVGDKNRIQEFEPDGGFKREVPLPAPGLPGALAFDPSSGNLLFSFYRGNPHQQVYELSPTTGTVATEYQTEFEGTVRPRWPQAVAADSQGNVYVADSEPEGRSEVEDANRAEVIEFGPSGELIIAPGSHFAAGQVHPEGAAEAIRSLAVNSAGDLIVGYGSRTGDAESYVRVYGDPPAALEPPPALPPSITGQFAASVTSESAVLKAQINPHYFKDTTYFLEYGLQPCSTGPCVTVPAAPGELLTSKVTNAPVTTAGTELAGLNPGTTYHYRFTAQSGGGGPVVGEDRTFRTFSTATATNCPNSVFRLQAADLLPDCRAYELVSPVNKDNGDIRTVITITGYSTSLNLSARSGERFTYSSERAFDNPRSGPFTSQYLATRGAGGWSSVSLSPTRGERSIFSGNQGIEAEFKAFSPELDQSWLLHDSNPPLASCLPEGYANLYRRSQQSEAYAPLTCAAPTLVPPFSGEKFLEELQGLSEDGSIAVFRVADRLLPEAANAAGEYQIYTANGSGELHLVSVLPNGQPNTSQSTVGSANGNPVNRLQSVRSAVSADGSKVVWSAIPAVGTIPGLGKIFLRLNAQEEQSAINGSECTESSKACTIPVSEVASSRPAHFELASADGGKIIFAVEGVSGSELEQKLYEFNVAKQKATLIAGGVLRSLLGGSTNASQLYFVSTEALSATPNAAGQVAATGEPNLYFYDSTRKAGERFSFIGDVLPSEVGPAAETSSFTPFPILHTASVSADGRTALFTSAAPLTGYDNRDAVTDEPDREVFLYQAGTTANGGQLLCISCNPTGARPEGQTETQQGASGFLPTAAAVPTAPNQLSTVRPLSSGGDRAFFNSYDSLVPRDTNHRKDVYQWEAVGTGSCLETTSTFSSDAGGCVDLISSGQSNADSEFADASESGSDVFFTTAESLVSQDPGFYDLYDARVDGGFPQSAGPPSPCVGEACQERSTPPQFRNPASANSSGSEKTSPKCKKKAAPKKCKKKSCKKKKACKKKACKKKGCKTKHKHQKHKHRKGGAQNKGDTHRSGTAGRRGN